LRPRIVLSEVVAPTLAQWEAVNEHRFPNREPWHDAIAEAVELGEVKELPSAQQEALEPESISEEDRLRARTVLRAWTRPEKTDQDILTALGIGVEVRDEGTPGDVGGEANEPDESEAPEIVKKPIPVVDTDARRIEDWGGGSVPLGATLARALRNTIWQTVQQGVRWPELGRSQKSILRALGISHVKAQQAPQAVRIENAAGGGSLGSSRSEPLLLLEPTARNARLLTAFHRLSKDAATLEDLARVRNLTQQVEDGVSIRLGRGAADRATVNEKLRLMTLAACPLAGSRSLGEKPNWRSALHNFDELTKESGPRTPDWLRFVESAEKVQARLCEDIESVVTRSQGGGGAATALDISLVDKASLAKNPEGTKKKVVDPGLADQRENFMVEGEKALAQETQAVDEQLRALMGHLGGTDQRLIESTIREVESAMAAAKAADLLTPHESAEELRALRLPDLPYAAGIVKDALAAVESAGGGVTGDALFRIGAIDVVTLARLVDYLELASSIIGQSSDSAKSAIEQRSGSGESQQGDAVRSVASSLLEFCEVPR
jgi:hypothetical protein